MKTGNLKIRAIDDDFWPTGAQDSRLPMRTASVRRTAGRRGSGVRRRHISLSSSCPPESHGFDAEIGGYSRRRAVSAPPFISVSCLDPAFRAAPDPDQKPLVPGLDDLDGRGGVERPERFCVEVRRRPQVRHRRKRDPDLSANPIGGPGPAGRNRDAQAQQGQDRQHTTSPPDQSRRGAPADQPGHSRHEDQLVRRERNRGKNGAHQPRLDPRDVEVVARGGVAWGEACGVQPRPDGAPLFSRLVIGDAEVVPPRRVLGLCRHERGKRLGGLRVPALLERRPLFERSRSVPPNRGLRRPQDREGDAWPHRPEERAWRPRGAGGAPRPRSSRVGRRSSWARARAGDTLEQPAIAAAVSTPTPRDLSAAAARGPPAREIRHSLREPGPD